MVKVGFIVEGATEKIIIESPQFQAFLNRQGYILAEPVIDATGGGNLLPHNIEEFIERVKIANPDKIFILTDLEEELSIENVRQRIKHSEIETIFVAVKAIESWFLADTQAMIKFLKFDDFWEEFPEQTPSKPWDRIKEIINQLNVRGVGSKVILAKNMVKHYGFSIENSANHTNCPSAKEMIDYFKH